MYVSFLSPQPAAGMSPQETLPATAGAIQGRAGPTEYLTASSKGPGHNVEQDWPKEVRLLFSIFLIGQ